MANEEIIDYMMLKRKQMQLDMLNPPKSDIKFTISDKYPHDEHQHDESNDIVYDNNDDNTCCTAKNNICENQQVVSHYNEKREDNLLETINELLNQNTVLYQTQITENTNLITQNNNLDKPCYEEDKLENKFEDKTYQLEGNMPIKNEQQNKKTDNTQTDNTQTDNTQIDNTIKKSDPEPPPINALTKLTVSERNTMLQKLYLKAKRNVLENYPNETDQEKINKLIRDECDYLLNEYIEMN
jgi:hypothetical protein